MTFERKVELQRLFFNTGILKDLEYRKERLKRLLEAINDNEVAIYNALKKDLGKGREEAFQREVSVVCEEIEDMIDNLDRWSRKKKTVIPDSSYFSKSYITKEPLGVVLILAPWNEPFRLGLIPLIGAVAAGNCVILKSSKKSVNSATVIEHIINLAFDKKHVLAVDNIPYEELMNQKYDFIFFTGSHRVGKSVMRDASVYNTPTLLQLGGKNPCIIEESADLNAAAREIVLAKLINAGQTCEAPDYVVLKESQKKEFIKNVQQYLKDFVGDALTNKIYPNMIDLHHYMRLTRYLTSERAIIGGRCDENKLKIEPTLFIDATFSSDIMKEEIFGPFLPIISYLNIDTVIEDIKKMPKAPVYYIFSKDSKFVETMANEFSFDECCINEICDMGKYRGKKSFDTFSNEKTVLRNMTGFGGNRRYSSREE